MTATPEQIEKLLQLAPYIADRALSGVKGNEVVSLYKELSGDHNFQANCRGCVQDMFRYMESLIFRYEVKSTH